MSENTVNNGRLVECDWPDFVGKAGYQPVCRQVSYRPNRSGAALKEGDQLAIDGQPFIVKARSKSKLVPGFYVLDLVPA